MSVEKISSCILPLGFHQFVFVAAFSQATIMVLQNDIDLLNPPAELEKRKHKLKRLVQSPNSFFMDVKCQGCFNITTVFSHSQTVVVCGNCQTVLCQPTGGKARLTEGCSFRKNHCRCRVHDSGRLDDNRIIVDEEPKLEKRLSSLASLCNHGQLVEFTIEELALATDGFSPRFQLGIGSFGIVYKAVLSDGRLVAIKRAELTNPASSGITRIRNRREDNDSAFVNELESMSRLNHKNLVRLLGFYDDAEERVLVYEYMANGSLADHLHNPRLEPLTWERRLTIALDAARGIQYLHDFAVPPVIHRDIKSSNILLDATWTAKVSDFGLSQMGPTEEEDASHLSLRAAGTLGYIDPEYYRLQQLTTKSDVYSFGIVLLELLSGHKAIHMNEEENPRNVVDFVVPYILQDEVHRALDRRIPPPTPYEIESVAHVGCLAVECLVPCGRERPSMAEVVSNLEKGLAACLAAPQTEPLSSSASD
ncbi:hypothetical protein F2Q69_00039671 [Brassica cretica]|uniref:40S ribosomal protein S27 n=1 Tax=Brassica cretica TaxID=69181 RepID=A0A8S9NQM1_BRACR|nr:hypothetical protein F2Q69_00039671 [Brassica cretica]